ncbi:hypothetical protein QCA50_014131 [Cerrena zonata]|uniref:Zn(2)-C6 fungal-type domain-containing protein n=1 Tax=Cerrena zonata TaxID=2478898 RepID=A0AAW0FM79_9APHY
MHSALSTYPNDPGHAEPSSSEPTHSNYTASQHNIGNGHRASSSDHDDDGGKKKKSSKRRKVNHACLYCRRSHMTCDEGRPCQRCIKREIGHLCHDERRPSAKDKDKASSSSGPASNAPSQPPQPAQQVDVTKSLPAPVAPPQPYTTPITSTINTGWPSMNLTPQNAFLYQPETLGNEFSVLSDFLESLDENSFFNPAAMAPPLMSTSPYTNPMSMAVDNSSYMADPSQAQPSNEPAPPAPEKPSEEPPPVVLPAATKTERFFLTAADQASGTRNERLNMVIRSKYEAGLLKPYNYVKGYARLSRWMDKNVSQDSKQKILQPLSVLRPKFRSIAQSESLTDIDLVFIEEAFERLLARL